MRILSVVDARPQFVRLRPIVGALQDGWNILDRQLEKISTVAVLPLPEGDQLQPHGRARAAQLVADVLVEGSRS